MSYDPHTSTPPNPHPTAYFHDPRTKMAYHQGAVNPPSPHTDMPYDQQNAYSQARYASTVYRQPESFLHPIHSDYPQYLHPRPTYPYFPPLYPYLPPPQSTLPPPMVYPEPSVTNHVGFFKPSERLESCEDYDDYEPGGLHPICLGDEFFGGRYKIVHKLGFGGSSTVWLARDRHQRPGKLVALKALRADESSRPLNEMPDLAIPQFLRSTLSSNEPIFSQPVDHHFFVHGPNGSHIFLISPFAGPSIQSMMDLPTRIRRLRGDLARSVAKQIANAVLRMHRVGIVHGDICTSNILLRPAPQVLWWPDAEVYAQFCKPVTVQTDDNSPHVPAQLVAPASCKDLVRNVLLDGSILLIDFGQSYHTSSLPADYQVGAHPAYAAPEIHFDDRAGMEADIWALACVFFELRSGLSPIDHFSANYLQTLESVVYMLGRMPDPWWQRYEDREEKFEEDGTGKGELKKNMISIRAKLRGIGTYIAHDRLRPPDDGPLCEPPQARLSEEEFLLMADLLERMFKYRPEERMRIEDVVKHPWFDYVS